MLRVVTAHQFFKRMGSGKTKPCLIGCTDLSALGDGAAADSDAGVEPEEVELVVKFSAGCEAGSQGLVAEAMAAMLGADLDLPVPEPFLVRMEPDFVASIPAPEVKAMAAASSPWAFGSRRLPPQFAAMMADVPLSQALLPKAAEVLAFDILIANADRRAANPNCLHKGDHLAIYDHELAFQTEGVIGWGPPWETGGVPFATGPWRHVFLNRVKGRKADLGRLRGALEALTPGRIAEYGQHLPADWVQGGDATHRITAYIQQLRNHATVAMERIANALN